MDYGKAWDRLMVDSFNLIGCPNESPDFSYWKRQSKQTILTDMYNYCTANQNGGAPNSQQTQCCGDVRPCVTDGCQRLTDYHDRARLLRDTIILKYEQMLADYRQVWVPAKKKFLMQRLEAVQGDRRRRASSYKDSVTGTTIHGYDKMNAYLRELHEDEEIKLGVGDQLLQPDVYLAREFLSVVPNEKMGDLYFDYDCQTAATIFGEFSSGSDMWVFANGVSGHVKLWIDNSDCRSPCCGRWEPRDGKTWRAGDTIFPWRGLSDSSAAVTRHYMSPMQGYARIQWSTFGRLSSSSRRRATKAALSVWVNGVEWQYVNGESVSSDSRRRSGGHLFGAPDGVINTVEVPVEPGDLSISFGGHRIVRGFAVDVSPERFPRDITFSDRVQNDGCSKIEDQFYSCSGKDSFLFIKELVATGWEINFKMRLDKIDKTAAGLGFKSPHQRRRTVSWLLLDASNKGLHIDGGYWSGHTRDEGPAPYTPKKWHNYQIIFSNDKIAMFIDGRLMKLQAATSWNVEQFVIRSWRNTADVMGITSVSEATFLTVRSTSHSTDAKKKYFNFNMDDLNLRANKDYIRYLRQCRNGHLRWQGSVRIFTDKGFGGNNAHGRRDKTAGENQFEVGDILTSAWSCR
ncbi:unnamed protein product [Effrenium voratum]|nr:unnamed protein product [Effrenium voratum]